MLSGEEHSSWRSLLSGEKRLFDLKFAVDSPLTPALSPWRGSRFWLASKFAYDSVFQVRVSFAFTSVSPLSLWERARVRGF